MQYILSEGVWELLAKAVAFSQGASLLYLTVFVVASLVALGCIAVLVAPVIRRAIERLQRRGDAQ